MENKILRDVFSANDVEILDNIACYSGFLQVRKLTLRHRLYEGGWSGAIEREIVARAPGVGVLLYDPYLDKVLMVEQFRVGCLDDPNGPWQLELVAGLIDGTTNEGEHRKESAEEVGIREAEEEAGVIVTRMIPVCEYYNSPGSSTEKVSIFCAGVDTRNRKEGIFGLDGEHEDIRTVILPRNEATDAVREGKINNAMSIIALQWLAINLVQVKKALSGRE